MSFDCKIPGELFAHVAPQGCNRIAFFTGECCYSNPIEDSSAEKMQKAFQEATQAMGRHYRTKNVRVYTMTCEVYKNEDVLASAKWTMIIGNTVKPLGK